MRVVLDTNVLIDGFADDFSPQAKLIAAVQRGEITALVTPKIEREYGRILRRLVGDIAYHKRIEDFIAAAERCQPVAVTDVVIDDTEDIKFIEAALGGHADVLITNDRHLLDLGEVNDIRILKPAEAWSRFSATSADNSEWKSWARGLGLSVLALPLLLSAVGGRSHPVWAAEATTTQATLADKQAEIAELNQKIAELQSKKNTVAEEAELINNQIAVIAERLAAAQLELKATQESLSGVVLKKKQTEATIEELTEKLEVQKNQLRALLRLLYAKEQTSFVDVWLSSDSLSEVLAEQQAVQALQDESLTLMQELQNEADTLRRHEEVLAAQHEELAATSRLLAGQQSALDQQKKEQAQFLAAKKDEQKRYEAKIVEARAAREEIEAGLFALKSAGVKLSLTTASEMAEHASSLTGVRPSLLLAVLKIESNMGTNIGSGTFPDDMQPASREPFMRIAKALGRDPATMPISRAVSYGWGGAMGPAQIMPQTWEGIEPRLKTLLKKPQPDPYDLTDAIVGTAVLLADKGAATAAGEREAVGRYLAGPNWQNFPWYIERVFAVAAEYAKEGLR